jgi:hypothetical protein
MRGLIKYALLLFLVFNLLTAPIALAQDFDSEDSDSDDSSSEDGAGMADSSVTEEGGGDAGQGDLSQGMGQETESSEITIILDDDKMFQGEELEASILMSSEEDVTDGSLVIKIIKACSEQDCEVVYEETVDSFNIVAFEPKTHEIVQVMDVPLGFYSLNAKLEGADPMELEMMEGSGMEQSQQFEVRELSAKIEKDKSYIVDASYIGFSAKPVVRADSEIKGVIVVHNYGSETLNGLNLHVGVCELEYELCTDKFLVEEDYSVSVAPSADKPVDISFKSPSEKDGYNLRFTLKDSEGGFLSTFTGQFIAIENLIGIRSLVLNDGDVIISKGEQAKIEVKAGGLYQGAAEEEVRDVTLSVRLKNIATGNAVYEDSIVLPLVSSNPAKLTTQVFNFISSSLLTNFELCSSLVKDGKELNEKCLAQDNTFLIGDNKFLISTEYDPETSELIITMSGADGEDMSTEIDLLLQLLNLDTSDFVISQEGEGDTFTLIATVDPDTEYVLIINDKDSHRQLQYPISTRCQASLDSCCSGSSDGVCDPDCSVESDPDCSSCTRNCGENNNCKDACNGDAQCPNDPDCEAGLSLVEIAGDNNENECTSSEGDCCYPILDHVCDIDCRSDDPDCMEVCDSCWNDGMCSQNECENLRCQKCSTWSCIPLCNGTNRLRTRVMEMMGSDMDNDDNPNSQDDDIDGDGILNVLDDDDDNDGYSDKDELKRGTSPMDPNSKPKSRKLIYFLYSVLIIGLIAGGYLGYMKFRGGTPPAAQQQAAAYPSRRQSTYPAQQRTAGQTYQRQRYAAPSQQRTAQVRTNQVRKRTQVFNQFSNK